MTIIGSSPSVHKRARGSEDHSAQDLSGQSHLLNQVAISAILKLDRGAVTLTLCCATIGTLEGDL